MGGRGGGGGGGGEKRGQRERERERGRQEGEGKTLSYKDLEFHLCKLCNLYQGGAQLHHSDR